MDQIVLRFLCITSGIGIFLTLRGGISYFIKSMLLDVRGIKTTESKVKKHLLKIFKVITNGKHLSEKIAVFTIATVSVFMFMSFVMLKAFGIIGIAFSLGMAAMPYGYVRAKLYLNQVTGSFEGEILISEMINQYKICGGDIYETIDCCIIQMEEKTLSKKALFQLAIKLHSYTGNEELREALNDFTANWDTIWARMLADNIYIAVTENVNILAGLENIMAQGKEINKFIELNKKEGAETELMVKILCPLFFVLMLYLSKGMVGYSWGKIFKYEFTEPAGLIMFTLFVFFAAVNSIIFPVLGKQKYDF